jgi:membrane-associated phospholipid phosphatase
MFLAFHGTLLAVRIPDKGAFWGRAMLALAIAVFLAHVNRIFHFAPGHLLFPSGHTTFCFGLAISLGMLRPWTLAITLPLLVVLGISMVSLGYHTVIDILGAIPLVLIIYGLIHFVWRLPSDAPLDRAKVST